MTTKGNGKEQAARIKRLIDFIEMKSESQNFLASLSRIFFSSLGVCTIFMRSCATSSGRKTTMKVTTRFSKTIMHDLSGVQQNPETFCPLTAGYSAEASE